MKVTWVILLTDQVKDSLRTSGPNRCLRTANNNSCQLADLFGKLPPFRRSVQHRRRKFSLVGRDHDNSLNRSCETKVKQIKSAIHFLKTFEEGHKFISSAITCHPR